MTTIQKIYEIADVIFVISMSSVFIGSLVTLNFWVWINKIIPQWQKNKKQKLKVPLVKVRR